jgi:hypothetical protein
MPVVCTGQISRSAWWALCSSLAAAANGAASTKDSIRSSLPPAPLREWEIREPASAQEIWLMLAQMIRRRRGRERAAFLFRFIRALVGFHRARAESLMKRLCSRARFLFNQTPAPPRDRYIFAAAAAASRGKEQIKFLGASQVRGPRPERIFRICRTLKMEALPKLLSAHRHLSAPN